jgi:hypothetical protein
MHEFDPNWTNLSGNKGKPQLPGIQHSLTGARGELTHEYQDWIAAIGG